MNGVFLRLWLKEVRDQLIGQPITDATIDGRLVQISLRGRSLFLSLYPDIPAAYLDGSITGWKSLRNWADELRGFDLAGIDQSRCEPVFTLALERSDIRRTTTASLTVYLHRPAPNIILSPVSPPAC